MGKTCIFLIHGITKTNKELEKIASFLNSNKIKTITPLLPGHGTCPYDRETCFKHFWKTTSKDWFKYAEREFLKCRKKYCSCPSAPCFVQADFSKSLTQFFAVPSNIFCHLSSKFSSIILFMGHTFSKQGPTYG